MKTILKELGMSLLLLTAWRVFAEIWAYFAGNPSSDGIMLSVVAATLAVHLVMHRRRVNGSGDRNA